MAFTLSTGNKDAAAKRAAAIYGELLAHGIEATLARRRTQRPEGEDVATIGEYLSAAQSVMAVRPASFAAYAVYLRRIAGDILNLRSAQRAKTKQKRATRQAIENAPVSILTRRRFRRGGWLLWPEPGSTGQRRDRHAFRAIR
jgi:hypothetical protein